MRYCYKLLNYKTVMSLNLTMISFTVSCILNAFLYSANSMIADQNKSVKQKPVIFCKTNHWEEVMMLD